jgi:hypothetical protein
MADAQIERPRFCSQCGQPIIVADASFCKDCGAPLAGTVWFRHDVSWRPLTAFLLSVIPGLGQWYKGSAAKAFVWFVCVVFFYMSAPPIGLLLHAVCAGNAALAGAIREEALTRSARHTGPRSFSATARPRT